MEKEVGPASASGGSGGGGGEEADSKDEEKEIEVAEEGGFRLFIGARRGGCVGRSSCFLGAVLGVVLKKGLDGFITVLCIGLLFLLLLLPDCFFIGQPSFVLVVDGGGCRFCCCEISIA
jgi:hypothetical protein